MSNFPPFTASYPITNMKGSQQNPWFKSPKINAKLPSNVTTSNLKIKSFTINQFKEEIYLSDNKGNIIVCSFEGEIVATHSVCGFKIKQLEISPGGHYVAAILSTGLSMLLDTTNNFSLALKLEDHFDDNSLKAKVLRSNQIFLNLGLKCFDALSER